MFKKLYKKIVKPIKKLGRALKKGFQKFGKFVGKLGPIGMIGMMFVAPYVASWWGSTGAFAGGGAKAFFGKFATSETVAGKTMDLMMRTIKFAGDQVGKVYSSVTGAIKGALNYLPGGKTAAGEAIGLGDKLELLFKQAHGKAREVFRLETDPFAANTYTVKQGDNLASIAEAHGTDFKELVEINNISNPNHIEVGQELKLSGTASQTEAETLKNTQDSVTETGEKGVDKKDPFGLKKGTDTVLGTQAADSFTEGLLGTDDIENQFLPGYNEAISLAYDANLSTTDQGQSWEDFSVQFPPPQEFYSKPVDTHLSQVNKTMSEVFQGFKPYTDLKDKNQIGNFLTLPFYGGILTSNPNDWMQFAPTSSEGFDNFSQMGNYKIQNIGQNNYDFRD